MNLFCITTSVAYAKNADAHDILQKLEFSNISLIFFFFLFLFFFFWFGFYDPFKNISLISSRSFIEGGRKPENPEKNHLTIR